MKPTAYDFKEFYDTAIGGVVNQLVISGAQLRVTGVLAKARAVDQ